jgi:hypothetical protein
MEKIVSFREFTAVFEQNTNYPINNETNQTATGKEKSMIDELNKLLPVIADSNIKYSQKDAMRSKVLSFFSKLKCTIVDYAIPKGAQGFVQSAKPASNISTSADDWFEQVIQLGGSTNEDGSIWNIKYDIGVMYFSVDDQGKITDLQVG